MIHSFLVYEVSFFIRCGHEQKSRRQRIRLSLFTSVPIEKKKSYPAATNNYTDRESVPVLKNPKTRLSLTKGGKCRKFFTTCQLELLL